MIHASMVNAPLIVFNGLEIKGSCNLPILGASLLGDFAVAANAGCLRSKPDSRNLPVGTTNPSVRPFSLTALP